VVLDHFDNKYEGHAKQINLVLCTKVKLFMCKTHRLASPGTIFFFYYFSGTTYHCLMNTGGARGLTILVGVKWGT
jgi:hypothetical protein